MSQTTTAPVSVQTALNYYLTPEKGGTKDIYPGTASNFRQAYDTHPVDVTDLRSLDKPAKLDVQGFELVPHVCSEKAWTDSETIKDVAYKETQDLLKELTGATKVHVVGHLARRESWETAQAASKDLTDRDFVSLPSYATNRYCHVDQSYAGAEALLKEELSAEEGERLSKTRWAIINVWRPINRPIHREALAVCDARTVAEDDLHEVTLHIAQTEVLKDINTSNQFLTWTVSANEAHQWYYASELTPEEVLMIKIYDSRDDGRTARRTPHCAFVTQADFGPARESVEMRCLVFWEGADHAAEMPASGDCGVSG